LFNSGVNLGFAKANNLAIPYANAPLILFLNPDTILKKNVLQTLVDFLKQHLLSIIVSSISVKAYQDR
ncbi:MAG: glycosyltransferase, partial [Desulfobacterales bacterium]